MKLIKTEGAKLVLTGLFASVLLLLAFGTDAFSRGSVDIQLHDTYYVIPTLSFLFHCFLWLTYFIYLPLLLFRKFRPHWSGVVLIVVNTLLLLSLTSFYRHFFLSGHIFGDWSLPQDFEGAPDLFRNDPKDIWPGLHRLVTYLQAFLGLSLVYTVFRVYQNSRTP
jgi:hypothetical protein